jgi:8-oxo-dGTP diphosphatase
MIRCSFENGNQASLRHAVVDVLVLKGDQILLVKRTKKLLEGGKWALAGVYMDRDETATQAAAREVLEETGWQVKDLTLLTIRDTPHRPHDDRQNVAFVFFATATDKSGNADWESDEQQWFSLSDIPAEDELAFDHAEDIKLYEAYRAQNFALPVFG